MRNKPGAFGVSITCQFIVICTPLFLFFLYLRFHSSSPFRHATLSIYVTNDILFLFFFSFFFSIFSYSFFYFFSLLESKNPLFLSHLFYSYPPPTYVTSAFVPLVWLVDFAITYPFFFSFFFLFLVYELGIFFKYFLSFSWGICMFCFKKVKRKKGFLDKEHDP